MRVRSLVIDGAEDLDRVDSGELPASGLVVVFSPDEGRTGTTLSMMRRILFSASGNGHGSAVGTAHLSGSNGEFELSTNGSPESETFRRLGGAPANPTDLGTLFGAERGQLRAIFDVTSNDLPRDMFARGPRQSEPIATPSLAPMRQRIDELLGDDDSGEIGQLVDRLEGADTDLEAARQREASYLGQREREHAATAEVGKLCADLADSRRRRERIKTFTSLWPAWVKRHATERDLDDLEPIDDFPDSDVSIVEAQTQSRDAESAARTLRNQLRQARAERDALPDPGQRHLLRDRIDAVCGELPDYRRRLTAFTRARARHDEITSLTQRSGGPGPTGQDTDEGGADSVFDPAAFDLESARDWLQRSAALDEKDSAGRAELASTRASLKQLRNERQRAVRAAKTLSTELDDSDEYWRALWSLRDDVEELWEIQSQGEAAARAAEQRLEALENLDRRSYQIPTAKLRAILWIVAAGCFIATLWMTKQENALLTLVFGLGCVAAIVADFAITWRIRWASLRNDSVRSADEKLRYGLDRARQRRDSRWRSADEVTRRIEVAARALGLTATPNLEDIDAAEERLFVASRKLQQRGPLAETALAIHDQRDEEQRLMNQLREMREVREANGFEWEEWKSAAGLPADLAQSGLTTFLCEYDRLLELSDEAVRVDEDLRTLAPTIETWENSARDVLGAAGVAVADSICGRQLEDQLSSLRDSAHRSVRSAERHAQLSEKIDQLAEREAETTATAQRYTDLFAALREQSGTSDQAEFDRRREVYRKRRALAQTLGEHESVFVELLAEHKVADDADLRAELTRGTADGWNSEGRDLEAEIERLEASMVSATRERTVAANACAEFEQANIVGVALQRWACLQQEIRERATEWRALTLAATLIEEAGKSLSDRSIMLDHASSTLRALTRGELVRVTAPDGEGTVRIVDRGGKQYTLEDDFPAQWMRQLALSLRLGMVREASGGTGAVPVLIDDVLRHVEGEQSRATAREIHRLAGEQQVFYFTSHPASLAALRGAGEVSHLLEV